jgi:hypothetical protein
LPQKIKPTQLPCAYFAWRQGGSVWRAGFSVFKPSAQSACIKV